MNKIIITGGSGFIGTNLIEHFNSLGYEVCNIDKIEPRNPKHFKFWKNIDILDGKNLIKFFKDFQPTIVLHFAARTDLNGSNIEEYKENIEGVKNIIDAINSINTLDYAIFASSMLVCRLGYQPKNSYDYCPNTIYGESKVIGEKIILNSSLKIPWTIVRPTSIWGPWFDTPYKSFFDSIRKGLYFHPLGLRVRRSYGFVLNVAYQVDSICRNKSKNLEGKIIYLADYEPIELSNWSQQISKSFNLKPIREIPKIIFKIMAFFGDILKFFGFKNPPMTSFRLNNMNTEYILDTSLLENSVGKCPHDVIEGTDITCRWMEYEENP